MLEFALGFVVLWACFSGVFQYGYSLWVYNNLATAVTNGAVYASRAACDTRNNRFDLQAKNVVVYGNPAGTGAALMAGLSPEQVVVTREPAAGVPRTVTISIENFHVNSVFREFTFSGKPSCTMKFAGKYMEAAP
jgi:hypothetical protein